MTRPNHHRLMLAGLCGNPVTVNAGCIKVFHGGKVPLATKGALWPRGLTCTTTHSPPPARAPLPPPPSSLTPVSHQHIRAETDSRGKGWTSSHLSKSFMTLLLPAAFTPPDTKFKVISSSQCVRVCVCLCGESKLGCLFRLQCVILCMCSCVCECTL